MQNNNINTKLSRLEKVLEVIGLKTASNIRIEKTVVTIKSKGNSFLTVACLTLIGLIKLASPIIKKTFTIELPITLAKAITPSPLATLLKEIATSGAQVPKETIVRAINILGTLNFKAKDEAASTKTSDDLMIITNPTNKIIISKSISSLLSIPNNSINYFNTSYKQKRLTLH